jgi:hypothetical protein
VLAEGAEKEAVRLAAARAGLEIVIRQTNDARLAALLAKIDFAKLNEDQLEAVMATSGLEAAVTALLAPILKD